MQAVQIALGSESGGRVAVVFDGSEGSEEALRHAVAVARDRHGRLTVIAIAPKPWLTVALVGICPLHLEQEMLREVASAARRAVAGIPDDIPCVTIVRCGSRRQEPSRYLSEHEHEHDVLITAPSKVRNAWRARILRDPGPSHGASVLA